MSDNITININLNVPYKMVTHAIFRPKFIFECPCAFKLENAKWYILCDFCTNLPMKFMSSICHCQTILTRDIFISLRTKGIDKHQIKQKTDSFLLTILSLHRLHSLA